MKVQNNNERKKMTKYEVWQIGGGYYNTFDTYGQAWNLVDQLQRQNPNAKYQVIEVDK